MSTPSESMGTPLVSVAMITYNHSDYIGRAIEGVVSQKTEFPIELVIGEDCSTDGTREIVLEYQKQYPDRIRVITSERNVGARQNSRRTLAACSGKYLGLCEGDDYWHVPDKLALQVGFLEQNPDYGLMHSDVRIRYVESGLVEAGVGASVQDLSDHNAYFEILTGARSIWTPTTLLRRDFAISAREDNPDSLDPRFLMGDLQLWLEVSRMGKVKYLPQQLATRHDLSESASRSRDPHKMLRFVLSVQLVHDHYLNKYPCPAEVARQVRSRQAASALYYAFKALDHEEARRQLSKIKGLHGKVSFRQRMQYLGSQSTSAQLAARIMLRLSATGQRDGLSICACRP